MKLLRSIGEAGESRRCDELLKSVSTARSGVRFKGRDPQQRGNN